MSCEEPWSCIEDDDGARCDIDRGFGGFMVGDPCVDECGGTFAGLVCREGTCAELHLVGPGEACDDPSFGPMNDYCVGSSFGAAVCVHDDDSLRGICTAAPATGACLQGRCALDATCVDDACVAKAGVGERCEERGCLRDMYCSGDPPICNERPRRGESCAEADCADALVCNGVCGDVYAEPGCPLSSAG